MRFGKTIGYVVSVAAALCVAGLPGSAAGAADGQVTEFKLKDKTLKTKPASRADVQPLVQELMAFDEAAIQNNDAPPADAADRVKRMKALAPRAKAEVLAFAERIKKAGEVDQFNEYVAQRVKDRNLKQLSDDFKAEGGNAYALLLKAPARFDQAIADREPKDRKGNAAGDVRAIGLKAGWLRTTACYGFWFTVTLGYGTDHAHESCDALH